MNLIVFGATGKTGRHVVRLALEQGHNVTAFTRSGRMDGEDVNLCVAQGDIMDADSVDAAIVEHDAAIVVLGSNSLRDKTTLSTGTRNILRGMTRHDVGRLVVLSAAGVGESWGQISLLARLMFRTMLRNIYADHEAQEAVVRDSALDWTIVRAAILKDGPATGEYTASNTEKARHINRADLADFLVRQLNDGVWSRQSISVTA